MVANSGKNKLEVPLIEFPKGFGKRLVEKSNSRKFGLLTKRYREAVEKSFYDNGTRPYPGKNDEDRQKIENLKKSGGILKVRNLGITPQSYNERNKTRNNPLESSHVKQTATAIQYLLSFHDVRRLPEYYTDSPHFFVEVIGKERNGLFRETNFKLPEEAATVHPHKPFGPGVFGKNVDKLDSIGPDINAYFVAEKSDDIEAIGPIVYELEAIKNKLKRPQSVQELGEPNFRINPDLYANKSSATYGFGGAENVNVLGTRNATGLQYIRVDLKRYEPHNHSISSYNDLKEGLQSIHNEQKVGIDLERGDVLFVNNRKCALEWHNQGEKENWRGKRKDGMVGLDDRARTIVRLSFYLTQMIT